MENFEKNTNNNIEHIKKVYFWRSAFFGLIILAAGIAIGGASMSIVASHRVQQKPVTPENSLMPRLIQILGLKQQQVNKIRPIIDEHMQHLNEIREDARVDIANTLDQMNKEIYPILGEMQRNVWSNELIRIRRQLNPEPARNPQGAANRRRGAVQSGQGAGRYGRGAQTLNQRPAVAPRRGVGIQTSPSAPNLPLNNINEDLTKNDTISWNLETNDINE